MIIYITHNHKATEDKTLKFVYYTQQSHQVLDLFFPRIYTLSTPTEVSNQQFHSMWQPNWPETFNLNLLPLTAPNSEYWIHFDNVLSYEGDNCAKQHQCSTGKPSGNVRTLFEGYVTVVVTVTVQPDFCYIYYVILVQLITKTCCVDVCQLCP